MSPIWTVRVYLRQGPVGSVDGQIIEEDALAEVKILQEEGIPAKVVLRAPNRIVTIPRGNVAFIEHTRNPK